MNYNSLNRREFFNYVYIAINAINYYYVKYSNAFDKAI